jgi:uncharacterized FAD-dependent dehydrogenase
MNMAMTEEIIISGFGGQGVLSMGKILAYSGMMEGKEVTLDACIWTGAAWRNGQCHGHRE